MRRSLSFRARILLVVFIAAVLPLGVLGVWLTGATVRSGETLLRARLETSLDRVAAMVGAEWVRSRSELLDLVEDRGLIASLSASDAGRPSGGVPPPAGVTARFEALDPLLEGAALRDEDDELLWTLAQPAARTMGAARGSPPLVAWFAVHEPETGTRLGSLELDVSMQVMMGNEVTAAAGAGEVLAMLDRRTGASLLPIPFDPALLDPDGFTWAGDRWIAMRRGLVDPAVDLYVAAPLGPFTEPFAGAAGRGLTALTLAALLAMVFATALTTRLTESLRTLAAGADAVARGELDRQVPVAGSDEVGRVALSFNAMTRELRRTLSDLAARRGLLAVGEFATELAHEIRNPLTSVRLDLQMVEELLPEGSEAREIQHQALEEVTRLDRTVSGALHVARSGRIELRAITLDAPVGAAVRVASPLFQARGARLVARPEDLAHVHVAGDADALEQVFVNLLANAAEAVASGGITELTDEVSNEAVTLTVRDDGSGMSPDVVARAGEPFFTTRGGGTGLGLAIAARIVAAHAGELSIESEPAYGTRVSVTLPLRGRS